MRILGITRISHKTDEADRTERDARKIQTYAEVNGHIVVAITTDEDVSGAYPIMERPDTREWFAAPKVTTWDTVVVESVDRLTRDLPDFTFFSGWCKANGKKIISLSDNLDSETASGRLSTDMRVRFAQFEREINSERRADKRRKNKELGYYDGGRKPYGFKAVKYVDHFELEPDDAQASVANRMADQLIGGMSASAVARGLNDDGIPAAQGGRWTARVVIKIMSRPETVLSPEKWAKVQTALGVRAFTIVNRYDTALLLGTVVCGHCGAPLYANRSGKDKKTGKVWAYYRDYGGKDGLCKCRMVPQDKLDEAVTSLLMREIGEVELTERRPTGLDMTAKIRQKDAQITELDEAYAAGQVPARAYGRMQAKLEADRAELEIQHNPGFVKVPMGVTFRQRWESLDNDGRRAFLLKSGVKVIVITEPEVSGTYTERPGEVPLSVYGQPREAATSVAVGKHHRALVLFGDLEDLRVKAAGHE